MPPKSQPKTLTLSIKTHRLCVILAASQTLSIEALKEEVFAAINSHPDEQPDIPRINGIKDFELCREIKERGKLTGVYEILDASTKVKDNLLNWETVYIQFRKDSGELTPVQVTLPALVDEDEPPIIEPISSGMGKRKAPES